MRRSHSLPACIPYRQHLDLATAVSGCTLCSGCSMLAGPEHQIYSPAGGRKWPDINYSVQLSDVT